MLGLVFLLFQVVLGDLAPLYRQEQTVDKEGLRSYLVVFGDAFPKLPKDPKEAIEKWLSIEVPMISRIEAGYNINDAFQGFNAWLSAEQVAAIRSHKDVKYIEEDSIATATDFTDRQDWGQIRVNQRNRNLTTNSASYTYTGTTYPNQNLDITVWNFLSGIQAQFSNDGSRAEVCVIDTGVRATHQEISGRVDAQINFSTDSSAADGNGHGTHVAGSCCGTWRGVAPRARIVSAKALTNSGSGQWAWLISALQWCSNRAVDPSVTYISSMSLGGAINTGVNDAVNAASEYTIPVVAAGNENTDSCTRSPASAARAITVMASDKDDNKASFSNYGPCADIWAPGVNIHSGWYTSDTAYNTISGTSMATPLVSGLIAYYGNYGVLKRDQALHELHKYGVQDAIRNCPVRTVNILSNTDRIN